MHEVMHEGLIRQSAAILFPYQSFYYCQSWLNTKHKLFDRTVKMNENYFLPKSQAAH